MFLAATGGRATRRIAELKRWHVDCESATAVVGDKSENLGHYYRVVATGETFIAQLQILLAEYARLREVLSVVEHGELLRAVDAALDGSGPVFLDLTAEMSATEPTVGWLRSSWPEGIRLDHFRHRMASRWRDLGGRADDLFAQLGHAYGGEIEQAQSASWEVPARRLARCQTVIDELLRADGWTVTARSPRLPSQESLPGPRLTDIVSLGGLRTREIAAAKAEYGGAKLPVETKSRIQDAIQNLPEMSAASGCPESVLLGGLVSTVEASAGCSLSPQQRHTVARLIRWALHRRWGRRLRVQDLHLARGGGSPPMYTPANLVARNLLREVRRPVLDEIALADESPLDPATARLLVLALWQPVATEAELRRCFESADSLCRVGQPLKGLILDDGGSRTQWITPDVALLLSLLPKAEAADDYAQANDGVQAFCRRHKIQRAADAVKWLTQCVRLASALDLPAVAWSSLIGWRAHRDLSSDVVRAVAAGSIRSARTGSEPGSAPDLGGRVSLGHDLGELLRAARSAFEKYASGGRRNYERARIQVRNAAPDSRACTIGLKLFEGLTAADANKQTGMSLAPTVILTYLGVGLRVVSWLADGGFRANRAALLELYAQMLADTDESWRRDVSEGIVRAHDVLAECLSIATLESRDLKVVGRSSPIQPPFDGVLLEAEYQQLDEFLRQLAEESSEWVVSELVSELRVSLAVEFFCGLRRSESEWLLTDEVVVDAGGEPALACVRPNRSRDTKNRSTGVALLTVLPEEHRAILKRLLARAESRPGQPLFRVLREYPGAAAAADRLVLDGIKVVTGRADAGHYDCRHGFVLQQCRSAIEGASSDAARSSGVHRELQAALRHAGPETQASYVHVTWPGFWLRACQLARSDLYRLSAIPVSSIESRLGVTGDAISSAQRNQQRRDLMLARMPIAALDPPSPREPDWHTVTVGLTVPPPTLTSVIRFLSQLIDGDGFEAALRELPLPTRLIGKLARSVLPVTQRFDYLRLAPDELARVYGVEGEPPDDLTASHVHKRRSHGLSQWGPLLDWAAERDGAAGPDALLPFERIWRLSEAALRNVRPNHPLVAVRTDHEVQVWQSALDVLKIDDIHPARVFVYTMNWEPSRQSRMTSMQPSQSGRELGPCWTMAEFPPGKITVRSSKLLIRLLVVAWFAGLLFEERRSLEAQYQDSQN